MIQVRKKLGYDRTRNKLVKSKQGLMLIIRQIKLGPFFEGGEVGTVTSPL
jgi:hypothetical protein